MDLTGKCVSKLVLPNMLAEIWIFQDKYLSLRLILDLSPGLNYISLKCYNIKLHVVTYLRSVVSTSVLYMSPSNKS